MRNQLFKRRTAEFIETGSHTGIGIQLALMSGFSKIYSIELVDNYFNECVEKFKNNSNVYLILGDSYFKLKELLDNNPNIPFTYWLDGHYSGGDTGFGVEESPLMKELETILSREVKGELIYVDDMRLYREFNESLNFPNMVKLIKRYQPDAVIWYESSPYDIEDILAIEY